MNEANNPLIPPATFEFLVASLRFQADMNLSGGLGQEGEEPEGPNLPLVRHFVDMLAMLLEKTKGNLTLEEQRALENTLTELRFRYIQVFDQEKKKAEKAAEAAQG